MSSRRSGYHTRPRQGSGGGAPAGGVDVTSVSSSPPSVEPKAPTCPGIGAPWGSGSFALVQPVAVLRGSPLPLHSATMISAVVAATMPAPAEGAIQRTLQVDECSDWIIVLITIVTIAVITLVVGFQIGASRGGRGDRPTTARVHNVNPVHTNPVHHLDDEKARILRSLQGLGLLRLSAGRPTRLHCVVTQFRRQRVL